MTTYDALQSAARWCDEMSKTWGREYPTERDAHMAAAETIRALRDEDAPATEPACPHPHVDINGHCLDCWVGAAGRATLAYPEMFRPPAYVPCPHLRVDTAGRCCDCGLVPGGPR